MTKQITQSTPVQSYQHGMNDYRTYPPASGGGGGDPIILPLYWGFFGDSNTLGRASSTLPAISPHQVFADIWDASGLPARAGNIQIIAQGGRSLATTRTYAESATFGGNPWIHIEESGDQSDTGQQTPLQYGATFEAMWRSIHARWPLALKTAANAPNFGRAVSERYRDWETTYQWAAWGYASEGVAISYNAEMIRRIDILAADGILVTPCYIAERANALAAVIPGGAATLYSDTNPYHWSPVGRLIQALETFRALNWDVNALDLDVVTVHTDSGTDATYKTHCLNVINAV